MSETWTGTVTVGCNEGGGGCAGDFDIPRRFDSVAQSIMVLLLNTNLSRCRLSSTFKAYRNSMLILND